MLRFALVASLLLLVLAAPVRAGSSSTAALQVALGARGLYSGTVDGIRGPGTTAAVRRLQRRAHLAADGIVGPRTRRALGRRGRPGLGSRPLRDGMHGWDVAQLQFLLARAGFPNGTTDGGFGSHLLGALKRFQAWAGLRADGVAGPRTVALLRRPAPRSPAQLLRPVAASVGDGFGPRGTGFHPGFDYPAATGTPVSAAGRGCVTSAGWDPGGYGNLVVIRHRFGLTSLYGHLSQIDVRVGQCVAAGARVGRVGTTGFSTGPHLHFELRLRGAAIDPASAGL